MEKMLLDKKYMMWDKEEQKMWEKETMQWDKVSAIILGYIPQDKISTNIL